MNRRDCTLLVLGMLVASRAGAQVGYDPSRSPYRDLDKTQEITIITGHYNAETDPAHVAPQSGPLIGMRYAWLVAGPVNLTAEVSRVGTQRRVLDPLLNGTCTGVPQADCKLVMTRRWPIYFADFGTSLNLTGAKTWNGIVPEVRGGLGFVTDFHRRSDVGDFSVGTRFVLSYGTAIRWVPAGSRYQLRLDFGDRFYSLHYPESYGTAAPDGSMIRPPHCPADATTLTDVRCRPAHTSAWIHNGALTLGLSYLFGGF